MDKSNINVYDLEGVPMAKCTVTYQCPDTKEEVTTVFDKFVLVGFEENEEFSNFSHVAACTLGNFYRSVLIVETAYRELCDKADPKVVLEEELEAIADPLMQDIILRKGDKH